MLPQNFEATSLINNQCITLFLITLAGLPPTTVHVNEVGMSIPYIYNL